jgi:hypothetical protein
VSSSVVLPVFELKSFGLTVDRRKETSYESRRWSLDTSVNARGLEAGESVLKHLIQPSTPRITLDFLVAYFRWTACDFGRFSASAHAAQKLLRKTKSFGG